MHNRDFCKEIPMTLYSGPASDRWMCEVMENEDVWAYTVIAHMWACPVSSRVLWRSQDTWRWYSRQASTARHTKLIPNPDSFPLLCPLPDTVSLTSHSHPEKLLEVTSTSRGNPGFPAVSRERPSDSFFHMSWGTIPLPWLESNAAFHLATRIETGLPWGNTGGSLSSPS